MPELSRRGFVGLGALAGAGALVAVAPSPADAEPLARRFSVRAENVRDLMAKGSRSIGGATTARGALVDDRGDAVGDLVVTGTVLAVRGDADELADHQHHLLVLPHGTLAATGTVTHAGAGRFVVTGGTGAYAGARGSYTSTQTADRHGRGSAVLRVDLLP